MAEASNNIAAFIQGMLKLQETQTTKTPEHDAAVKQLLHDNAAHIVHSAFSQDKKAELREILDAMEKKDSDPDQTSARLLELLLPPMM